MQFELTHDEHRKSLIARWKNIYIKVTNVEPLVGLPLRPVYWYLIEWVIKKKQCLQSDTSNIKLGSDVHEQV